MNNKSILIGALSASLLFVSIGAGTQQEPVTISTVPESHVWEFHLAGAGGQGRAAYAFSINKKTGEVRKYEAMGGNNYVVTNPED